MGVRRLRGGVAIPGVLQVCGVVWFANFSSSGVWCEGSELGRGRAGGLGGFSLLVNLCRVRTLCTDRIEVSDFWVSFTSQVWCIVC